MKLMFFIDKVVLTPVTLLLVLKVIVFHIYLRHCCWAIISKLFIYKFEVAREYYFKEKVWFHVYWGFLLFDFGKC